MGGLLRVAAAMQSTAHELEVPVRRRGCAGPLFTIETPQDGFADDVAACRARGRRPFLDGPALRAALARVPGMIDRIKTVQGIAAIVAVFASL